MRTTSRLVKMNILSFIEPIREGVRQNSLIWKLLMLQFESLIMIGLTNDHLWYKPIGIHVRRLVGLMCEWKVCMFAKDVNVTTESLGENTKWTCTQTRVHYFGSQWANNPIWQLPQDYTWLNTESFGLYTYFQSWVPVSSEDKILGEHGEGRNKQAYTIWVPMGNYPICQIRWDYTWDKIFCFVFLVLTLWFILFSSGIIWWWNEKWR